MWLSSWFQKGIPLALWARLGALLLPRRADDRGTLPASARTLEDRLTPASLTVTASPTNITDTSVLTLRDAIELVNKRRRSGAPWGSDHAR